MNNLDKIIWRWFLTLYVPIDIIFICLMFYINPTPGSMLAVILGLIIIFLTGFCPVVFVFFLLLKGATVVYGDLFKKWWRWVNCIEE